MAFDIKKYTENSVPVEWGDLDFSVFKTEPLDADTLRVLHYMCEVEYHTVCYMRDLLMTPSHEDTEVGAFMTTWNREEYWHGAALADLLKIHGITVEYDQLKAKRVKLGWRDRLDPIKQGIMGNLIGRDFVATHMTWGMVNERSAAAGYRRMAQLNPHPALAPLLKRLAAQETKHIAFYTTQAQARLEKSPKARKFTRFALQQTWGPVGSTIMPEADVKHMMTYLFGGEAGLKEVRKIDAQIAEMPGLEGLTLMETAFAKLGLASSS
jgi:hypothetical protein